MTTLGYDPTDTTTDPTLPSGIGNLVSADIIALRHPDGANQLGNEPGSIGGAYSDYTGYFPINSPTTLLDPNRWQPLLINGVAQAFLTPHWGQVTPFSLTSGSQFLPPAPMLYPGERYTQQASELLALSASLTDQMKCIVEYWADGSGTVTPPGHWNSIAQFVSRRDGHTIDKDIKMFFALTNALLDSSISVWYIKRHYDSVRPISAIRFLYKGIYVLAWGGPGTGPSMIKGEVWKPYLPTPPFAEYVSGHSTFSAAGAQVLELATGSGVYGGSSVFPAGTSMIEPGMTPMTDVTLSWPTFKAAANEAGISRRYAGIHFRNGDLYGRGLGKTIGNLAYNRAQYYIDGGDEIIP